MTGKSDTDLVSLEDRMAKLEGIFQSAHAYIIGAEASLQALSKLVKVSNKVTEREIDILLRTVVRLLGLEPKHWTKKHLIKALLEDEYGVKLSFRKKEIAGGPTPQRER